VAAALFRRPAATAARTFASSSSVAQSMSSRRRVRSAARCGLRQSRRRSRRCSGCLISTRSTSSKNESCRCPVSYTHLRAHETRHDIVCRLLLEKKKKKKLEDQNTLKISTMKHKKKNENNK